MIVVLAMGSAFVFGGAVVLQQHAAMLEPVEYAARPSLLVRLFRRPLWLIGLGADLVGFALQAAALRRGSLIVVQPLITTSLLFTLIFASAWHHEPISRREWSAVLLVLAGLSIFLVVASPTEQSSAAAEEGAWLLTTGSVVLVSAVMIGAGLRAAGRGRAALFGVAAGVADATMAVLGKAFAGSWDHGLAGVARSWTPYALIAAGLTALLLISTAYQAGHPTVSLPIITVTDPLVGSCIGISLFGEELRLGGVRGPIVVVALAIMVTGLVTLGRDTRLASIIADESPSHESPSHEPPGHDPPGQVQRTAEA